MQTTTNYYTFYFVFLHQLNLIQHRNLQPKSSTFFRLGSLFRISSETKNLLVMRLAGFFTFYKFLYWYSQILMYR